MNTENSTQNGFIEFKTPVNIRLAGLWATLMFMYIYVDYFHLYMPNVLSDLQAGRVFTFDITQDFLLFALVSVSIPAIMIFLSLALPAKINRIVNLSIASLYIPYTLFNLVGEAWLHMYVAALLEVVLLGFIIMYACKWPRG